MGWSNCQARDPQAVRRLCPYLLLVPAVALLLVGTVEFASVGRFSLLPDPGAGLRGANVLMMVLIPAILTWGAYALFRASERVQSQAVFWIALGGASLIFTLNVVLADLSAGATFFYLLPIVAGGYLLRWLGSVILAAATCVFVIIHSMVFYPLHEGLTIAVCAVVVFVVATAVLVSARNEQERTMIRLRYAMERDALTGLVNRHVFERHAEAWLTSRGHDASAAVLMVDVDYFKDINDSYGHPVGDRVLIALADILGQRISGDDVVCRLGGDEIAVFLADQDAAAAKEWADQLLLAAGNLSIRAETGWVEGLSLSVGVAHAPSQGETTMELLAAADLALYQAKQAGRGRVLLVSSSD